MRQATVVLMILIIAAAAVTAKPLPRDPPKTEPAPKSAVEMLPVGETADHGKLTVLESGDFTIVSVNGLQGIGELWICDDGSVCWIVSWYCPRISPMIGVYRIKSDGELVGHWRFIECGSWSTERIVRR